jgi:hypothetical protein
MIRYIRHLYFFIVACAGGYTVNAQNGPKPIYLGLYGGSQLVHVRLPEANIVMRPARPAGWAWGAGIISNFDLAGNVSATASGGLITEKAKFEGEFNLGAFHDASPTQFESEDVFTWLEFSSSLFFKPIQRRSYSLVCGFGFTARNQINSYLRRRPEGSNNYTPAHDLSGYTFSWNYALPLQAGAEFQLSPSQRIICLAGFQFGLRGLYAPMISNGISVFEDGYYKLNSTTLRLIYLFGLNNRSRE